MDTVNPHMPPGRKRRATPADPAPSAMPLESPAGNVPRNAAMRRAIREAAASLDAGLERARPLTRAAMEPHARAILARLGLPGDLLGFAMVAVNNVFWFRQYAAVPYPRRLLLLPRCLRRTAVCRGILDHRGLACAACGACSIDHLRHRAERLGYRVWIAEGSPGVLPNLLELRPNAVLGVACLDSLERAFRHVAPLGIPHLAVPLLLDGCRDTRAEEPEVLRLLNARGGTPGVRTPKYVPLLYETADLFERTALHKHMIPHFPDLPPAGQTGPAGATGTVLFDWLCAGGRRFRPFMTAAAYAAVKLGPGAFDPVTDFTTAIPPGVRMLCRAIEALHKASLIHDDIEDGDEFRYGRPTLHREHGIGPAINFGDALVGLGYRWIAAQRRRLGAGCVGDILAHVAAAQIELCRGQGAELFWQQGARTPRPLDVLEMYALKTSPAFETALYSGLRAAGAPIPRTALRRFSTLAGEAFQVLNDLADWRSDPDAATAPGRDALARRPTILRAFALEHGGQTELDALEAQPRGADTVAAIRQWYGERGVFDRTESLWKKLRQRAVETAQTIQPPHLGNLMLFILDVILAV